MPRTGKGRATKQRITISVGTGTAEFLRTLRARTDAPSLSACVENLVSAYQRQIERQRIETQTRAYYDGASEVERREEAAWGDLGAIELAEAEQ